MASRPRWRPRPRRPPASPSAVGDGRRDLTALDTFTVDPATARDFDDAVSAQPDGDGTRLWIHIADVAAHVRPGGALEREAFARGTSTYVPGSVEPMLPRALSDDACSLAPGVERLAVTMEVRLSAAGEPRDASFYRSVIRSDARLDYDQLDRVFAGAEPRSAPGRRPARPRPARSRVARGPAARILARGGELGAGVRVRLRRRGRGRPLGPADGGAPADRAPDDPRQRAGGRAAGAAQGADPVPGSRAARPAPGRAPRRAARGARDPDAAVAGPALAAAGRGGRGGGEPAGDRARPPAADTAGRRIHPSSCAPSSRPTTATETSATPGWEALPTRTSRRRSGATRT